MARYSKNPGNWRTSANGSLKAHRPTCAGIGNAENGRANGKPIDGKLDPSTVQHGGNRKGKRVKRIAITRDETRMTHHSARTGKNARKRAERENRHLTALAACLMLAIAESE
jgi:hypothetical protein